MECHSNTDSVGSHSDVSNNTIQAGSTSSNMARPNMDVVCIIDIWQNDNSQRKRALDAIKLACVQIGANFSHLQVTQYEEEVYNL